MSGFVEELPSLFRAIYRAGVDPALWPDCLEQVARVFEDAPIHLYVANSGLKAPPFLVARGMDEKVLEAYAMHFSQVNPYPLLALAGQEIGRPTPATELICRAEGMNSEFYNDWMKPNSWALDHIGVTLAKQYNQISALTLSPLGSRPVEEHVKNISLLVPSFIDAIALNKELAEKRYFYKGHGVGAGACYFILDQNGKIRYQMPLSDDVSDLININSDGQLSFRNAEADKRLQRAIMLDPFDPEFHQNKLIRITSNVDEQYCAFVTPYFLDDEPMNESDLYLSTLAGVRSCKFVIIKKVATRKYIRPEVLRAGLGISKRQAEIASALLAGETLNSFADGNQLSIHYVRSAFKDLRRELGLGSQQQLIAYLMNFDDF